MLLPIQRSTMKLPFVLFLTTLACRQIQAWERSAIDTVKPGGFLQTSYSGTLHEPDAQGEDHCIGTFRGTNSFEHNSHHLSNDSWESFTQKCKEVLGGIIQMVSTCASDRARSTVDIDLKSRVINNGKFCSTTQAPPKLHTECCHQPVQPVHAVHKVYAVRPVHSVHPAHKVHSAHPVHSVHPSDPVKVTVYETKPEYNYPDLHHSHIHHHPGHHHPSHHHHSDLHHSDHHHIHHEKALEARERLEEKESKTLVTEYEPERRHVDKVEYEPERLYVDKVEYEPERLHVDKMEYEPERRHVDKVELEEMEIVETEKIVDDELVTAAIHEKEEEIKLLEKQKRELERLRKSADRELVTEYEPERRYVDKVEYEPERRHIDKMEYEEVETVETEKIVDDELVTAAIHEKDEGIKLLEKQKRELERLRKSVDKKF